MRFVRDCGPAYGSSSEGGVSQDRAGSIRVCHLPDPVITDLGGGFALWVVPTDEGSQNEGGLLDLSITGLDVDGTASQTKAVGVLSADSRMRGRRHLERRCAVSSARACKTAATPTRAQMLRRRPQ